MIDELLVEIAFKGAAVMCYSMFDKRSGAAKKSTDSDPMARTMAEKTTSTGIKATSLPTEEKAYSGFMSRVRHWVGKDEHKEKENAT